MTDALSLSLPIATGAETVKVPNPQSYDCEFHPLANIFPLIVGQDFEALVEDVKARGLLHPITMKQGKILDGRNRYRAAQAAGHRFTERDFRELAPSLDAEAFVISTNVHRRQMDTKQKRKFIANLIERKPGDSDRAIAKLACVDNKTVASVREELRNRTRTFLQDWDSLNATQRQEFITAKREELKAVDGLSAAGARNFLTTQIDN